MSDQKIHPYMEPGYKLMTIAPWPVEPTSAPTPQDVTASGGCGAIEYADPSTLSPFEGAPRAGIGFDDARDGALAADILANGIIEPAIIWNDGELDRLISGNRRRAVCLHLRQLGENIAFPVRRLDVDFATAFSVAHASNTGRERPTAMQQAKAVAWAVHSMKKSQKEVAKLLGFDEAKVSRLLTLSSLPDWLKRCATDPDQLSEKVASQMQGPVQDAVFFELMKQRAEKLTADNRTLSGADLARYLLTGSCASGDREYADHAGNVLVRSSVNSKGLITLKIPPVYQVDGFDLAWLTEAVQRALAESMAMPSA